MTAKRQLVWRHKIVSTVLPAVLGLLIANRALSAESKVTVTNLSNGLKVIVREERSSNLAAVDIWVRAGSANETPENNGISHLVEHLIFKATKKRGPGEIDREIEGIGAELNGGTSRDWVHFYTTVASEYLPIAIDVLADALTNPLFLPEDVEREKQVIIDEIARAESNPKQRAYNIFYKTAFGEHPYALPTMGTRETIAKLTRDDVVAYYHQHYTTDNTCVVIAGDVSATETTMLVEQAFREYRHPNSTTRNIKTPKLAGRREVSQSDAKIDKAYVITGYMAAPASEFEDLCALDIMLAVLGDTHRGRISSALATRGLKFEEVSTDYVTQKFPTTFSILAVVDARDTAKTKATLVAELEQLTLEPVSNVELAQAKRIVESSDAFEQKTVSGKARTLGIYECTASYEYALKYGAKIREITAAEVLATARKYFRNERFAAAVILPDGSGE